jgi:hypothetical protein
MADHPVTGDLRQTSTLENLQRQMRRWNSAQRRPEGSPALSTGLPLLDSCLPGDHRGILVELLSRSCGAGASLVAFLIARQFGRRRGTLVVVDPQREFYPPGAAPLGLDLDDLVVVRPQGQRELLWALEQSLRSPTGATVICPVNRLTPSAYRRLKLAAERGGSCGLLLRSSRGLTEPSWADMRVLVDHMPVRQTAIPLESRRLRLEVVSASGSSFDQPATLIEIRHDARVVSVAAELADSAIVGRSA